jgi:hypothetical protein
MSIFFSDYLMGLQKGREHRGIGKAKLNKIDGETISRIANRVNGGAD